jgi:S-DNA-T family DNA segregation ATPase FtsK/SpoIIIE
MQGVYVSDEEIDRIVQHWRKESDKMPDTLKAGAGGNGGTSFTATQKQLFSADDEKDDEVDDLYDEAVELVRDMEKASISLLQRHLRIGYTRAARLIEAMEERGIVGEHEGGSAPREVLEDDEEDEE